ncbi:type II secretion system protein [bacterium]|nr:type II secretion system protein [bacterium]
MKIEQRESVSIKAAFTLAEVLITLGIIGIVAAMTLPTMVNNIRHKELETSFKKAYSSISQALKMYEAENGVPLMGTELAYLSLKPSIMPYFKTVKDCGFGHGDTTTTPCVISTEDLDDDEKKNYTATYKTFSGNNDVHPNYFDDGQFVINDGMLILLENYQGRAYISVDVNGHNKRPNKWGHDLFTFQLTNIGKLLPMGVEGTDFYSSDNLYCSKTSTSIDNGAGCTAKALSDPNYFKNLP